MRETSENAPSLTMVDDGASGVAVDDLTLEILREREGSARQRRRKTIVFRSLVLADVIGLTLAYVIAEALYSTPADRVPSLVEDLAFLLTLPGWILFAKLYKLYDRDDERADHSTIEDLGPVFHLVTLGTWLVVVAAWASGAAQIAMTKLVVFWVMAIGLVVLNRALARAWCRRRLAYYQNTLVFGAGTVGQLVARKIRLHRDEYRMNLVGLVDSNPRPKRAELADVPVLDEPDRLAELVQRLDVERVVVAFSREPHDEQLARISELKKLGVQVDIVPRLYEIVGPHVRINSVEGVPLVSLPTAKLLPGSRAIKRAVDIVGAVVGIVLTAPLMAYIAVRIRRDSPGPVLFRQTRLGLNMKEFTLLKFRTMRTDVDNDEHREYIRKTMSADATVGQNGIYKLERSDAITPFGRWVRGTSLDELPQLFNVLRGDMSLVGPRPCLAYETEHFKPHHFERFEVPQGITGLWQVTARAHATFGEALDMDVAYARSWSLGLDLWLLLRTPIHLLRRKGTA
jgi:exopolysaccharide biosynthesis polyprenyl glycosylphosphotransferase